MTVDQSYHYPADLLALLIDTIPVLVRGKRDVLQFFRSAGVPERMMTDLAHQLATAASELNKYEITRRILTRLNEGGDLTLQQRREVVRRVVEFEEFSTCWPEKQAQARGLVSQVQKLVNVKDAFTRMHQEREDERRKRQEHVEREARAIRQREEEAEQVKTDFFRLFDDSWKKDPWGRGKALEGVLNRLFKFHGILVRDAFTLRGDPGQGVIEQIDGVVELDGQLYLLEMKWWESALGPGDVSQHMVRVFNRGQARGIYIASAGFTEAALTICKDALQRSVFVLCELAEFVRVVNERADLKAMLKAKVQSAIIERQPLFRAWIA